MKTKQLSMISAYKLKGNNSEYMITIEKLNNSIYGNPRFKVVVIDLKSGDYSFYNEVFRMEDYGDDLQIAEKAVKEFEKRFQK